MACWPGFGRSFRQTRLADFYGHQILRRKVYVSQTLILGTGEMEGRNRGDGRQVFSSAGMQAIIVFRFAREVQIPVPGHGPGPGQEMLSCDERVRPGVVSFHQRFTRDERAFSGKGRHVVGRCRSAAP